MLITQHSSLITPRAAFTLLEVILATSILATVSGIMYWFFFNSIETTERDTNRARDVQLVRVVLDRMVQELRQAGGYLGTYGPGVIGDKNAISINTTVLPDRSLMYPRAITEAPPVGQFDIEEVRYYIAWDEENLDEDNNPRSLGLVRRVSKTFLREVQVEGEENAAAEENKEAAVAVKEELYAPQIKYIQFKYFDGATWWDDWQISQGNALPQVVRVVVGFEPELPEEELEVIEDDFLKDPAEQEPIPEDRYVAFVRLVEADTFFGSRLTREASAFGGSEAGGF